SLVDPGRTLTTRGRLSGTDKRPPLLHMVRLRHDSAIQGGRDSPATVPESPARLASAVPEPGSTRLRLAHLGVARKEALCGRPPALCHRPAAAGRESGGSGHVSLCSSAGVSVSGSASGASPSGRGSASGRGPRNLTSRATTLRRE